MSALSKTLSTTGLITLFIAMAEAIERDKGYLCELDGAIGDADHGISMSIGFSAVRKALEELPADIDPTGVFNTTAKSFLNAVGASAGPLYATAFMRAGASVKGKTQLSSKDVGQAIQAMANGIQSRGKACVGDKTMYDAWHAAAEAMDGVEFEKQSVSAVLKIAADAAEQGAQSTRDMQARKGRSAKLGERSIGHLDAGAVSTALLLKAAASVNLATN